MSKLNFLSKQKNFLEKLIPSKLDLKLKERKKLKTTYNNLVSAIILSTENNKTILINEKKQIENKINDIDNFIAKKYKNFYNINKIKIYSVDEIQKSLNKNEAMIYLINEFFHQAFVITKNEFHLISDYSIGRERTKKLWI